MLKKILCKFGFHKYCYHYEVNIKKFDIKSKDIKKCENKFWQCQWCEKRRPIK